MFFKIVYHITDIFNFRRSQVSNLDYSIWKKIFSILQIIFIGHMVQLTLLL